MRGLTQLPPRLSPMDIFNEVLAGRAEHEASLKPATQHAHATDPADFVRQVTVYPNDLTTEQVARFDLLLFLSPNERGELAQVDRLVGLTSDGRGLVLTALAAGAGIPPSTPAWLDQQRGVVPGVSACDISHSTSVIKAAQTADMTDLRAGGRALREARGW